MAKKGEEQGQADGQMLQRDPIVGIGVTVVFSLAACLAP